MFVICALCSDIFSNLLSISKTTRFLNCPVIFFLTHYEFLKLVTRKMIGTGCECGRLYYLNLSLKLIAYSSYVSAFDYHYRLGNPPLSVLKFLISKCSQTESLQCESCQLGKHHWLPFPNRVNKKANHPFDLVHLEVWSMSIKSKLGFHYFITFVDDYSHVTWLYLMKSRCEIFSIFQNFVVSD